MEDRTLKAKTNDELEEKAPRGSASPYKGRLMAEAWEQGRAARTAGAKRETCPLGDYPGKQFRRAWQEGFDSLGPAIKVQVPPIVAQSPAISTPGMFLPPGAPVPTCYRRPEPLACGKCRAILLPLTLAQAVLVRSIRDGVAYVWCRACGHQGKLPVAPIERPILRPLPFPPGQ